MLSWAWKAVVYIALLSVTSHALLSAQGAATDTTATTTTVSSVSTLTDHPEADLDGVGQGVGEWTPHALNEYIDDLSFEDTSSDDDDVPCSGMMSLPDEDQCAFVSNNTNCEYSVFNYYKFIFCQLPYAKVFAFIVLFLWLIFTFLALGTVSEDFFCPNLATISDALHVPPNVAGVTLLALGNGAPDIFSVIAAMRGASASTAIGALVGAGNFVTGIVFGIIVIVVPFRVDPRTFLRDAIFYLLSVIWLFILTYVGEINLGNGLGFLGLYVVYVASIIYDSYSFRKIENRKQADQDSNYDEQDGLLNADNIKGHYLLEESLSTTDTSKAHQPNVMVTLADEDDGGTTGESQIPFPPAMDHATGGGYLEVPGAVAPVRGRRNSVGRERGSRALRRGSFIGRRHSVISWHISHDAETRAKSYFPSWRSDVSDDGGDIALLEDIDMDVDEPREKVRQPESLGWALWERLKPFDGAWGEQSVKSRVYIIVTMPLNIMFKLTVPVVDTDDEFEVDGYNRILYACNCTCAPLFILFAVSSLNVDLGHHFALAFLSIIVGLPLGIASFYFTEYRVKPRFQKVYAVVGFLTAILWIYWIANELVSLLEVLGNVLGISPAFLGMTVLAWGNSIGDGVSNAAMARAGFPAMGAAACYGGPLLNVLFGVGLASIVNNVSTGAVKLEMSIVLFVGFVFLIGNLIAAIATVMVTKFVVGRTFGSILISIYAMFILVTLTVSFTPSIKNYVF